MLLSKTFLHLTLCIKQHIHLYLCSPCFQLPPNRPSWLPPGEPSSLGSNNSIYSLGLSLCVVGASAISNLRVTTFSSCLESQVYLLNQCHSYFKYLEWVSFSGWILIDSFHFFFLYLMIGKITLTQSLLILSSSLIMKYVYCYLQCTVISGMRDKTRPK